MLTLREKRTLEEAAKHPNGVFRPWSAMNGLAKAANERSVEKLIAAGLIEPNAHGDWYITEAGRKQCS